MRLRLSLWPRIKRGGNLKMTERTKVILLVVIPLLLASNAVFSVNKF